MGQNTRLHFNNYFSEPIALEQVQLYQAGDCYAKNDFEIEPHRQVCDEISYIVSGEADFYLGDAVYPLRAGDLFFCPRGSVHKIVSNAQNPVRYYFLGYRIASGSPSYDRWREIDGFLHALCCPVYHSAFNMNHLFSDLLCEFQQDFHLRDRMIEIGVWQIVLHTYKYFSSGDEGAAVYEKRVPSRSELVYEIVNFIDNHVLRLRSLHDVSDYIGFSYSYTAQIFADVMHQSMNDYYQKKRFEEALKLLKRGMNITQTAEILGFNTVPSFSRAFKSHFGLSPQKYLRSAPPKK